MTIDLFFDILMWALIGFFAGWALLGIYYWLQVDPLKDD